MSRVRVPESKGMHSPLWNFPNIFSWNISNPFLSKKEKPISSFSSISPIKLLPKETNRNKNNFEKFFLEFSSNGQTVGKIILQIFEDVGPMGECFKDFVTMRRGFGYKGSRIYAVQPGEWCLIGDLLFEAKNNEENEIAQNMCDELEENVENVKQGQLETRGLKRKAFTIYEGNHSVPAVKSLYEGKPGSLMTVNSSINTFSKNAYEWAVGPQFKITFVEPAISSGTVFGEVISGISGLRRMSERTTINTEPTDRITISDCGIVSGFK